MQISTPMQTELVHWEEVIATLSHELRTPLTAIIGYARLLKSGKLDPSAAEQAIQAVYRNAELQSQLVSDLLDISRIVSGKLQLKMSPIDLDSVIQNAIDCVRIEAEAKSIRVQYKGDRVIGSVTGDAHRLQQVICNLLTNAIKFTPVNGCVEVRLFSMDRHAEIKVIDNGLGLSPEFLPHVFEKFRQADNSAARQNGGLGLGLAIVRDLVKMHGGIVEAESKGVGRGSTFTVKLPLRTMALQKAS
jgi:signal transduction histidine kinase